MSSNGASNKSASIDKLMMSFADLGPINTTSKCNSFKGPAVKDIIKNIPTVTDDSISSQFKVSQRSRDWSTLEQNLQQAFISYDTPSLEASCQYSAQSSISDNDFWATNLYQPKCENFSPLTVNEDNEDFSDFISAVAPSPPYKTHLEEGQTAGDKFEDFSASSAVINDTQVDDTFIYFENQINIPCVDNFVNELELENDFGDFVENKGIQIIPSPSPGFLVCDLSKAINQTNSLSSPYADRYAELLTFDKSVNPHDETTRALSHMLEIVQQAHDIISSYCSFRKDFTNLLNSPRLFLYLCNVGEVYRMSCRFYADHKEIKLAWKKLCEVVRLHADFKCKLLELLNLFEASLVPQSPLPINKEICSICRHSPQFSAVESSEIYKPNDSILSFAGRMYHSTCANFWINCVNMSLPNLV